MKSIEKEARFSRLAVGKACSEFSVNYGLISCLGMQFVAYYDENRQITLASRRIDSDCWDYFKPQGFWIEERKRYSNFTEFDSHNYLTMALDGDGYIHVAGNMHVDPLTYFRSTKPLDIASLVCVKDMTGERESRATYPLFFKDADGNLIFRHRDGMSGNGDDLYNILDRSSPTWRRLLEVPLMNGEGARNAYSRLPMVGPDKYWHMIWVWRESPLCETNNNLSYARSKDLLHWEDSAGTPVSLPITRSIGEIVDPSPVEGGLINMSQELGFTNQGRPLITYHRYDANGKSQVYAALCRQPGKWEIHQLSDWDFRWDFQGGGSISPDVIISRARAVGGKLLEIEYASAWCEPGVWVVDEDTMQVVECRPRPSVLPKSVWVAEQGIHQEAVVNLVAGVGSDNAPDDKYYLRWEALPIHRDVSYGCEVSPSLLEVLIIDD